MGMRNSEGYYDPTAGKAIRNVSRKDRRPRGKPTDIVTYRLGEIRAFRECVRLLSGGTKMVLKNQTHRKNSENQSIKA